MVRNVLKAALFVVCAVALAVGSTVTAGVAKRRDWNRDGAKNAKALPATAQPTLRPACRSGVGMTASECSAFAPKFEPGGECYDESVDIPGLPSVIFIGTGGCPAPCALAPQAKKNPRAYCRSRNQQPAYQDAGCRVWDDCSSVHCEEKCLRQPNCAWDGYCHTPCDSPWTCKSCYGDDSKCCNHPTDLGLSCGQCGPNELCTWCPKPGVVKGAGFPDGYAPCCKSIPRDPAYFCDTACVREYSACPMLSGIHLLKRGIGAYNGPIHG